MLSFFTGTAALASAVAQQTVLDPDRAGEVAEAALDDPGPAATLLARLVPDYPKLKNADRAAVNEATDSAEVRAAARQITFDDALGEIDLLPLRQGLVVGLRDVDQPLARSVAQDTRDSQITVPAEDLARYQDARRIVSPTALWGSIATAALLVAALVISPHRIRTLRSVGIALLLIVGVVGASYWLLTGATEGAGTSQSAQFAAIVIDVGKPRVVRLLVPLAIVAVGLILAALLIDHRPRRAEPVTE